MSNVPLWVPLTAIGVSALSFVLAIISLIFTVKNARKNNPAISLANLKVVQVDKYSLGVKFSIINAGRLGTSIDEASIHYRFPKWTRQVDVVTMSIGRLSRDWHQGGRKIDPAQTLVVTASTEFRGPDYKRRIEGQTDRRATRRATRVIRPLLARRVRVIVRLGNGTTVKSARRASPYLRSFIEAFDLMAMSEQNRKNAELQAAGRALAEAVAQIDRDRESDVQS